MGHPIKLVAVVKFESRSGQPIALFSNYGVNGTGMGQENYRISGDVPGATSQFVEKSYGGRIVPVWTSGAGGDQCRISDRAASRLTVWMPSECCSGVVRVAKSVDTVPRAAIQGAQRVVTCAGHRLTAGPRVSLLRSNDVCGSPIWRGRRYHRLPNGSVAKR